MIRRQEITELLTHSETENSPILSVFLNVDQRQAVNLNRGFLSALKGVLKEIEVKLSSNQEKKEFQQNAEQVIEFISVYEPHGKSLVLYCNASKGVFWHRDLHVPLQTRAHWQSDPYVRPLFEVRDEFERLGVILTDRAQARLFTVVLGEIEENREALADAEVRKFDASGSDQMRSQMNFQRKSDEHARWHLKNVAQLMDRLADQQRFDSLILAGSVEALSELKGLLSERLKKRLVGVLSLPIDAAESRILEEVLRLQAEAERAGETSLVERLLTAAAKDYQAVIGLRATLQAAQQGRIRELVYADGFSSEGGRCLECDLLLQNHSERCPDCEGKVQPVDDIVERVLEKVVRDGGKVEQVRGEAAATMIDSGGGVGAILRF